MLKLLGALEHDDATRDDSFGLPKRALILATRLAIGNNRHVRRLDAAQFLWPDNEAQSALNNLRQVLRRTRIYAATSGFAVFESDDAAVWLHANLSIDLNCANEVWSAMAPEELARLLSVREYELLAGISVSESILQDWIHSVRDAWQYKAVALILSHSRSFEPLGRAEVVSQLLNLSPYDEGLFREYIEALIASGQTGRVLSEWDHFCSVLRKDLGAVPEPSTRSLVSKVVPSVMAEPAEHAPDRARLHGEYTATQVPSLLILPPESSGIQRHASESAIAGALVNDVIDDLATLRSLATFAPHTARRIRDDLNCRDLVSPDYVFHTRLKPSSEGQSKLRLGIRLVRSSTDQVLFADNLTLAANSLPDSYAKFARSATAAVVQSIETDQLNQLAHLGKPTAFTHYLLAKGRLQPFDLKSIRSTRIALNKALDSYPHHLPSKSLLSRVLVQEWFMLARTEKEGLQRAVCLAREVIDEAPTYAMGYWALAEASLYLGDLDCALENAEMGRNLAAHVADLLFCHADILVHAGAYAKASHELDLAFDVNPLAPDTYYWTKASAAFLMHDYASALVSIDKVRSAPQLARLKAACHAMLGNKTDAARWRREFMKVYPDFRLATWSQVVPSRDPHSEKHYKAALSAAGFK